MLNDKPLTNKQALLKELLPIAINKNSWLECINNYFNYCCNIINLDELTWKPVFRWWSLANTILYRLICRAETTITVISNKSTVISKV